MDEAPPGYRWVQLLGPENTYLQAEEVAAYLGVSTKTLERLVRAGVFPPPAKYSPGSKAWWRGEAVAAYCYLCECGCTWSLSAEAEAKEHEPDF